MQRRSAARDSSPNAPACRSRRGDAPEGSPVFSPDVEGRSPEDSGKEELGKDIRPRQGVALIRESDNRCDTLAGSRLLAMPGPRVFGATHLDLVAKQRAPTRGASFPTLHNELMDFCATQMRHPYPRGPFCHPGVMFFVQIAVFTVKRG